MAEFEPSASVDVAEIPFPPRPFSTTASDSRSLHSPAHKPNITNCSTVPEHIFVRGTNFRNPGGTVIWTLSNSPALICSQGTDIFGYEVAPTIGTQVFASQPLGTEFLELTQASGLAVGTPMFATLWVRMPCQGSNGAGETMGSELVFMATF